MNPASQPKNAEKDSEKERKGSEIAEERRRGRHMEDRQAKESEGTQKLNIMWKGAVADRKDRGPGKEGKRRNKKKRQGTRRKREGTRESRRNEKDREWTRRIK